ncbi:acetyltransferase [Salmonella enterica subsp. enterica serovar Madelia]|nr:acetyltransferase [Salmonella enterica subsp. enterica serovar Madelia]
MLIRVEIPIDAPGIDALLRRSFESDAEAKLVHDLREDGFLTLGLVATDDEGQVVGYVAFSPVDVQGEDLQWVGMAPLVVDEKYRGQGLARQLVYEGLDSLNEFGLRGGRDVGRPGVI